MNWPILILFGMAAISFAVWLTIRNQKDEKEFEQQLNNDIKKDQRRKLVLNIVSERKRSEQCASTK